METDQKKLAKLDNEKLPSRFFNREISSLKFHERVLEEAQNKNHPLLERIKFLSISGSNVDEFYMVRVAGIKDLINEGDTTESEDGLSPKQQLEIINEKVRDIIKKQKFVLAQLQEELTKNNIFFVTKNDLSSPDTKWLKEHFLTNIFPALTPIAIDPAHPFPFLPNLGLAIVLHLRRQVEIAKKIGMKEKVFKAVIPLPQKLPRFIVLPEILADSKKTRLIKLEDILEIFQAELFPGCEVIESGLFRIIRDSDLDAAEEAEDILRNIETSIKERRKGDVILLKANSGMAKYLLEFVEKELGVDASDVILADGMLGIVSLKEIYEINRPELKFPPMNIRFPERITDFGGDCFAAIHSKDIVVHHPYESFDVVVQFIRQAAADPDVVAIKQTLYRTSHDSPIVKALVEAADAGKSVTALVELKARFDEEANIKWARNLERAGVQVIYGFVNFKTHAKVSLVVRRVASGLQSYVHFGTGNYHPITAKVYSDLSYFTSDPSLCRDASHLFNYLTGYSPPENFEKIAIAPLNLRKTILDNIHNERENARQGKKAGIWLKANSLVDKEIIDALYDASNDGVKIELVIRGICCLKPGVKGLSENIRVKSIVGRFLEHARIYCFGNGFDLPTPQAKVFISSADMMPRNLDWRIELLVPIENPTVHEQILGQIMAANVNDVKNTWVLDSEGNYNRLEYSDKSFSAHEFFINNPSLSGRGKALKKNKAS